MKTHALRLIPEQDLKHEIISFIKKKNIKAGCIITTVGSLKRVEIRLAGGHINTIRDAVGETYEIVSLVGTLSQQGVHLHISLSDKHGTMIGGHLLHGCKIYTTAEIIIGELEGFTFERPKDISTGCNELLVIEDEGKNTTWRGILNFLIPTASMFVLAWIGRWTARAMKYG